MLKQNSRIATRVARVLVSPLPRLTPPTARGFSSKGPKTLVTSVQTNEAYAPIKAAGQVWLSGQIPADAEGNLIQGSITEQTETIIKNTEAILKASGTGLERVVKVVVYVRDADIMPDFASVYDAAFPHRPARSMVEVSKLPAGVDIQVDFTAVI
ncbi:uncharacterized protein N7511_002238 [Penicillium nucicola]|uniref:uncharacterized protein n=1 Tax=Penicillium nucicola TaxID=1850975 RepID=UPI00254574D4|nr:uncharacterized protein N7511_002238 [Penicillium nucicola]KAJ5770187.1 hypothetical protein N7511_002238 [Penicillium nucicola]